MSAKRILNFQLTRKKKICSKLPVSSKKFRNICFPCYSPPQFMNFFTSSYKTNMAAAPVLRNIFDSAPR